jgi:NAD(P)H dehydrogenase (quinone)
MPNVVIVYHSETGNTEQMANLIAEGVVKVKGAHVHLMRCDALDEAAIRKAHAVFFGSPTYYGSLSWQMKRCLDTLEVDLTGKIGAVFASGMGGGGYELAELTMLAALLVRGMLVYSGGTAQGHPPVHFGAVSYNAPEGHYREICLKLGENVAAKARELFGE